MSGTHSRQREVNGEPAERLGRQLEMKWRRLCARYLRVSSSDPVWRYNRELSRDDPEQGWKLHVSATVLTAVEVFRRVAPVLSNTGVLFKAPVSLAELGKLNSGLFYSYSQVGKFITVYARNDREAVSLARNLDSLTEGMDAPQVPFDERFRRGCVYYRYGAFHSLDIEQPDGTLIPGIRDPDGKPVPDVGRHACETPAWVSDPFRAGESHRAQDSHSDTPLRTSFRVFRAIAQRGKGGVYNAVDFTLSPPRLCVVKEGRAQGETGWDGSDGRSRVRNEEAVLRSLRSEGVNAPQVYSSFEARGNLYLVLEHIEGETLAAILARRRHRLSVRRCLEYVIEACGILSEVHRAGWVWRDCKPSNLIVTRRTRMRPLDFETATPIGAVGSRHWYTPSFSPPPTSDATLAGPEEDLYAVGALLYFLLVGRTYEADSHLSIGKLRRGVSRSIVDLAEALLDPDAAHRPDAETSVRVMRNALVHHGSPTQCNRSLNRGSGRRSSKSGSTFMNGRTANFSRQAL
jgi:class IV lanthipeptide synthase